MNGGTAPAVVPAVLGGSPSPKPWLSASITPFAGFEPAAVLFNVSSEIQYA